MSSYSTKNLMLLVNNYMISDDVDTDQVAIDSISNLSNLLATKKLSLLFLVQNLGDYLTNEQDLIALKSINCLSSVLLTLSSLNPSILSPSEINHLLKFFISKFEKINSFKFILISLNSLIKMDNFNFSNTELILNNFNDNYNSKNFNASIRYQAFQILKLILDKYLQKIISISRFNDLFVNSFISMVSGEKDPRNLILSFNISQLILLNFKNLNVFKESLFDVTFCYFPISFKTPKNDPYKITSDQLKFQLSTSLTSNPILIDDLYPNLFDKLTTTSSVVKSDILNVLELSIQKFPIEIINQNWIQIWDALKFEILYNDLNILDKYTKEAQDEKNAILNILNLFKSILSKFSKNDEFKLNFLNHIFNELSKNITTPDEKLSKQSFLILSELAQVDRFSFNFIIKNSLPQLFTQVDKNLSVVKQKLIISHLSYFLNSYKTLFNDSDLSIINDGSIELFKFKDDIIILLSQALISSSDIEISLKALALEKISLLMSLSDFLTLEEHKSFVQYFIELLLTSQYKSDSQVYKTIINSLVYISNNIRLSSLIIETVFPLLISLLPDTPDQSINIKGKINFKTKEDILLILSLLSSENNELLHLLFTRLLNRISILLNDENLNYNKKNYNYAILLLNVIYNTLTNFLANERKTGTFIKMDTYLNSFLPKLITLTLKPYKNISNNQFIELSSRISFLIILNCKITNHQSLLIDFFNIFIHQRPSIFFMMNIDNIKAINVIEKPSKSINIFANLVASIDFKTTKIPNLEDEKNYDISLTKILNLLISCYLKVPEKSVYKRLGYLKTISLLVDKWFKLQPNDLDVLKLLKLMELYSWITKGLLIKNDTSSLKYVGYLIELLKKSSKCKLISLPCCKLFDILLNEDFIFKNYEFISNSNNETPKLFLTKRLSKIFNINIKSLYKQKLFEFIIPKLVENYESIPTSDSNINGESYFEKINYLVALSFILKYVEPSIFGIHLNKIFPLLLQSIKLNDKNAKVAALKTIDSTISECPDLIKKHLPVLVSLLIDCITDDPFKKSAGKNKVNYNSEEVRYFAIKCLKGFTQNIEIRELYPYSEGIIRNLVRSLDDKKRKVRKIAIDCRQEYFEIFTLNKDED
ncbi:ARM repeat-containing protein [Ascoidea rubescens DSM 1968]|uniref:MMS19 nucleotide excision repair protein n=1 Tax=Ascoidea rubescens DSM 1968 TaxID=1344418 RepID=A0A1D2VAB3_9ASCO|nr:ARM repeat-containing protein [Ascoidea rubescens DSM 1968]ODV58397.1 ARM repeat-containing protein [Ascoidea rubescens DSM 1968]